MKKIIGIVSVFMVIFTSGQSQDYASSNDGYWKEDATWTGTGYPNDTEADSSEVVSLSNNDSIWLAAGDTINVGELEFGNNSKLYIPDGAVLYADSISVLNNADFYIDGDLITYGGINMRNNSTLDVDLTGNLDIGGDFYGSNNVSITNDGDMNIDGDLYLGSGATLEGAGTVTADTYSGNGTVFGSDVDTLGDGVTYTDGGGSASPLPIELVYFEVVPNKNSVELKWQTAIEENNDYFTIERSYNGVDYHVIATILGAGNSSIPLNYTYTDYSAVQGVSYYRLKQTDYDGQFEVFSPVSVALLNDENIKVGPNPVVNHLNIIFGQNIGSSTVKVINMYGAQVYHKNIDNSTETIDLSHLIPGKYMVIIAAEQKMITKKIVKQ